MRIVVDELSSGEGRIVDRRRAVGLAALIALGLVSGAAAAKNTDKDKKRKGRKKDKGKNQQKADGNANEVVRVAKKYKGAKYKWGGDSPRGFDCSGFTWYVYQKATGMDISHGVDAQWKRGRSVGRGDWKPGDLVFFKNTFERGLSHNGICIGGDEFIHAENERTGVVISSLKSEYYNDHYAGARRLL